MDAHPIDTDLAFPELATRVLDEDEIHSDRLDFPRTGEDPLGVFRGLVAAAAIQIGIALLAVLGWQVWHFFR